MSQLDSSKRLCRPAGLMPGNNGSAGKKKSVRTTRAGVYLKPALVEVAHAAVKSKTTPYYAIKYEWIHKRRGKKRAIIAVARMILTAVYNILSTGEVWNPTDLSRIDMPPELREKGVRKSLHRALKGNFIPKRIARVITVTVRGSAGPPQHGSWCEQMWR
jgi:hypothetical protein